MNLTFYQNAISPEPTPVDPTGEALPAAKDDLPTNEGLLTEHGYIR